MQKFSLDGLPNSPGWKVIHDANDQLYYLENDKKNRQFQAFTSRKMAEKALYDYLVLMVRTAPRNLKKNVHQETATQR